MQPTKQQLLQRKRMNCVPIFQVVSVNTGRSMAILALQIIKAASQFPARITWQTYNNATPPSQTVWKEGCLVYSVRNLAHLIGHSGAREVNSQVYKLVPAATCLCTKRKWSLRMSCGNFPRMKELL